MLYQVTLACGCVVVCVLFAFFALFLFLHSLWCSMVLYGALWCSTVLYGALRCSTVLYGALWCSMVLYGVIVHGHYTYK